jgi:putative ABC transport system substrate-binding protein
MPMEQSTKFELVVNMKTASALDFAMPRAVIQRADQVIE